MMNVPYAVTPSVLSASRQYTRVSDQIRSLKPVATM